MRNPALGRRNLGKVELAQRPVVPGHFALALEDVNLHRGLVVGRRGECLAFSHRDCRIALDEPRRHAAEGLDAQRERGNVQQEDVLDVARQNSSLNRSADGDHLVRVHPLVGVLAEEFLDRFLNEGHPGRTADENHLVNLARLDARVVDGSPAWPQGPLHQVARQLLKQRAGELDVQVLGPRCVRRDEGQVDIGFHRTRKLDLGLLGLLTKPLQGHRVLGEIEPLVFLELLEHPLHDELIDVVAAKVGVAVGRLHLDHVVADLEDRHVERPAAEVVDGDQLVLFLVEPVGQRGGRRLVDDPQDVEARDLACVLGRLALAVVEVGGHGHDRVLDFLAQIVLGRLLELLKDHSRNLGRGVKLSLDFYAHAAVGIDHLVGHHLDLFGHLGVAPPHEPLVRVNRVRGVRHRLALGHQAHQALLVLCVGDDARGRPVSLLVGNHGGLAALHDRHDRVCRSQIDSDYLSGHFRLAPLWNFV